MARSELERTAQQSLLDRLIDVEPHERSEPPSTWAQSVRHLKAALRRDLEWLLNTRRIPELPPDECEELQQSLYLYGLPDISSMGRDSTDARLRLLRYIEQAIATFEPRLSNVRVTLAEADASPYRQVHFLIEGMLRLDPSPEPVVFDTVLEVGSGEYQVRGEGGGGGGAG